MRTQTWQLAAVLAAAAALGGCGKIKPCKDGSLFAHLVLDGVASTADSLQVSVQVGDVVKMGAPIAKRTGSTGTLEIDFADGYPANQSVVVTVNALSASVVVGTGSTSITLGGKCQQVTINITAVNTFDMGVGVDGGNDLAGNNACSAANCASGFCADGVCCDKPCQGQCEACDLPGSVGTCMPVTGAPHSHRPSCNGKGTACAGTCDGTNRTGCLYPGASTNCGAQACSGGIKTLAVSCDGTGNCPAPQQLQCTPPMCNAAGSDCAMTCSTDSNCTGVAGKPYCDHGVCTANKPNGRACTSTAECNSGNCIDGVCCDQACGGQCQACDVSGSVGTCTPVTSGMPHGVGSGTRPACAGSGTCQGSCAAGQTATCTLPTTQCAGGSCSNGVVTAPVYCNNGSCPSVSTAPCPNGLACNAAGTGCLTGPCTSDASCQAGYYCAAGGTCTPQKPQGGACNPSADCAGSSGCRECTTGNCVDGYCCNSTCTGQCQACDGATKGTCAAVTGAPHGIRAACTGTGVCAGACDGANVASCAYPTVQCTSQTCSGGVVTLASSCSNGSCVAPTPPTQTCGSGMCMGTGCSSGCTSDANCGTGKYCDATGTCQTQKGNGLACGLRGTTNGDCYASGNCAECSSGFCVDGYCCGTACSGQCQNCNSNPGSCQLTGTAAAPKQPVSNAGTARSACAGSGSCQQACNGSSATACADPSPEPTCVTATCSNGVATPQAICSGGSCPSMANINCAPYTCNAAATACLTSCTKDTECKVGDYCDSTGKCQPQKAQGMKCGLTGTTNADCYNNANCAECGSAGGCVDGYCCNSTCTNNCDACSVAGKEGTCSPVPAGGPVGGRSCGGNGSCAGTCDGTADTCNFPSGNSCVKSTCSGKCDGFGGCDIGSVYTCGTNRCCPSNCPCSTGTPKVCQVNLCTI